MFAGEGRIAVGVKLEFYFTAEDGSPFWAPCTVTEINIDGTFVVLWDNGERMEVRYKSGESTVTRWGYKWVEFTVVRWAQCGSISYHKFGSSRALNTAHASNDS